MAHTARATKGFELIDNLVFQPSPPREFEMTPSLAGVEGDALVMTLNKVALAAAGAKNILGVAAETVTAHATKRTNIRVHITPYNIYRCTFADHRDSTATGAGTTTTLVDSALTDSANIYVGGTIYFYEGPGLGETRIISAYNGTDTLTWIDAIAAATSTSTKYVLVGAAVANEGIGVGSFGVNLKDENTIDADATIASEAGPLAVIGIDLANLTMDVLIRKPLFGTRAAGV